MSETVLDGSLATKFRCIPADKRNSAAIGSTPINSARVTGCVGLKVPFLWQLTIALLKGGEVCPMPYALCQIVPHVIEKGYILWFRANRTFPALQREISTSL